MNKVFGMDEADVIDMTAPAKIGKTTWALQMLEFMADTYGEDGCYINLDMTTPKMARKYVSHVAQVADDVPQTPEQAVALRQAFLDGIKVTKDKIANREGNVYFCYPKFKKMDDLYALITAVIRRYGVKWIVFDNIQRACDVTVGSMNRTQHISTISKTLAQFAKDYNIQMIRLIQPHAIRKGEMCTPDDSDGSSQVTKDCDSSCTMFRKYLGTMDAEAFNSMGHVEAESGFDPKTFFQVGLNRYGGGIGVTLYMDGAKSTLREYDIAEIAASKAVVASGIGSANHLASIGYKSPPAIEEHIASAIKAKKEEAELVEEEIKI